MPLLDGLIHEGARKGMFEDISPLLQMLIDIPGIEAIDMFMYKFYVRKSSIFTWEEIDPKINQLLKCIPLACGEEEVIRERRIADAWQEPVAPQPELGPSGNGSIVTGT